jgi:hypothetical protein
VDGASRRQARFGVAAAQMGGLARSEKLSPEEKRAIARQAAAVRWHGKKGIGLPQATHSGALRIGDSVLSCGVLPDGTRVLTRPTFLQAIGRTGQPKRGWAESSGSSLPVFVSAQNLQPFIPSNLATLAEPIAYRDERGVVTLGYRAELLPLVCQVYQDASEGRVLQASQLKVAEACRVLYRGFATVGIVALVDEATGYQNVRAREALQAVLDAYLKKEFAEWAKRFPDEFYELLFKLRGWTWHRVKARRPVLVGKLTKDLVYERLAPGILEELEARNPVTAVGRRNAKHHQWLTEDVGHPALSRHIRDLIVLMRSSSSWSDFKTRVELALPKHDDSDQFRLALDGV